MTGWWCNHHLEKWWSESQWEGWHPIYIPYMKWKITAMFETTTLYRFVWRTVLWWEDSALTVVTLRSVWQRGQGDGQPVKFPGLPSEWSETELNRTRRRCLSKPTNIEKEQQRNHPKTWHSGRPRRKRQLTQTPKTGRRASEQQEPTRHNKTPSSSYHCENHAVQAHPHIHHHLSVASATSHVYEKADSKTEPGCTDTGSYFGRKSVETGPASGPVDSKLVGTDGGWTPETARQSVFGSASTVALDQ